MSRPYNYALKRWRAWPDIRFEVHVMAKYFLYKIFSFFFRGIFCFLEATLHLEHFFQAAQSRVLYNLKIWLEQIFKLFLLSFLRACLQPLLRPCPKVLFHFIKQAWLALWNIHLFFTLFSYSLLRELFVIQFPILIWKYSLFLICLEKLILFQNLDEKKV